MTKSEIQLVKSLADKKGRAAAGLFVAEGEKLVGEIAASALKVRKIYAAEDSISSLAVDGGKTPVEKISAKEMDRISNLKTASKVLALVEIPKHVLNISETAGELILALDNIQDPGNMGTMIRTADWFGIRDIICSESTADCFNPKVVQASMGAVIRVRVHYVDMAETLEKATAEGVAVYGTFLEGENIYNAQIQNKGIIVMGSEGQGISPQTEKSITRKLFIPPYPAGERTSESLNVSTAAAIVCSEFRRRL